MPTPEDGLSRAKDESSIGQPLTRNVASKAVLIQPGPSFFRADEAETISHIPKEGGDKKQDSSTKPASSKSKPDS